MVRVSFTCVHARITYVHARFTCVQARMYHDASHCVQNGCTQAATKLQRGCNVDATWMQRGCNVDATKLHAKCNVASAMHQRCMHNACAVDGRCMHRPPCVAITRRYCRCAPADIVPIRYIVPTVVKVQQNSHEKRRSALRVSYNI